MPGPISLEEPLEGSRIKDKESAEKPGRAFRDWRNYGFIQDSGSSSVCSGGGSFARSEYEKRHFVTETFEISSDKLKTPERNLVFLSTYIVMSSGRKTKGFSGQLTGFVRMPC